MRAPTIASLSVLLAAVIAFAWLRVPELHAWSLQLVAGLFLLYVFLRGRVAKKLHHFLPTSAGTEFPLLVAASLLAVGATGGLTSPLLPLLYVLVFLGILTLPFSALTTLCLLIPVFLWGLLNHAPAFSEIISLLTLPCLLPVFILAKVQAEELQHHRQLTQQEEQQRNNALLFLNTLLLPKLESLKNLSQYPEENNTAIKRQLDTLTDAATELSQELSQV